MPPALLLWATPRTHTTQNETAPKQLRGGFENNKNNKRDNKKEAPLTPFIVARVPQGVKSYSLFRFDYGMRKPS